MILFCTILYLGASGDGQLILGEVTFIWGEVTVRCGEAEVPRVLFSWRFGELEHRKLVLLKGFAVIKWFTQTKNIKRAINSFI